MAHANEKVRLAVIGAGAIGMKHARLVRESDICTLAGMCDVDPGRRALVAGLGAPFYDSAEELVTRQRPDGAIVATPNAIHAESASVCARHGVHALIEKPIADSLAAAEGIVRTAEAHGVRVLVGHHRRHSPLVQQARAIVRDGAIGKLAGVSVLWALLKPDDYFHVGWRGERPGGGPVLINLIHDLDSLRFICGEIREVYARTASGARGLEVEDSVSVSLAFENGALGTILASDATPAPWSYEMTAGENPLYFHAKEDCYHFFGTEGSLAFPSMQLWRYADGARRGWQHPLERSSRAVASADPLRAQLDHFCRVVRGQTPPLVDGPDATRSLAAALAVLESARRGSPVDISRH